MTVKQWICFLMSTLGIVLITGIGDLSGNNKHFIGILFGLGAAVFYASVILLNKFIRNVEGIHRTFLQFLAAIVVLAVFCLRSAVMGRSSFYTIGACTAVSILLAQTILNVMGTVDLLPFTGVTFPFVSNGGTSMIGAWGLLAFVKAADTRQNASFAVRLKQRGGAAE